MRNKLKIASLVLASFALTSCKTSLLYGGERLHGE
jgi:predicted small secreted protein